MHILNARLATLRYRIGGYANKLRDLFNFVLCSRGVLVLRNKRGNECKFGDNESGEIDTHRGDLRVRFAN